MTVDAANGNNNIGKTSLWYTPAAEQKKNLTEGDASSLGGGVGFAPDGRTFAELVKTYSPVPCAENH